MKIPKRLIYIIAAVSILLFLIVTIIYYIPINVDNKCHDEHIYRWKFAVYNFDTIDEKTVFIDTIGGFKEYIGINKLQCMNEIIKRRKQDFVNLMEKEVKAEQWKKLDCGLWQNKYGELGIKDTRCAGHEGTFCYTNYIKTVDVVISDSLIKEVQIKDFIDFSTFKDLDGFYYKDKNHVYCLFSMACGSNFFTIDADACSFKLIGDYYAKDKNHIYCERHGILEDADYKTFKTKIGIGSYAKDKYGYFDYYSRRAKEDMNDPEAIIAIDELDKMK